MSPSVKIRLNIDPIDVIWGGWVGEIITSIRHYLWQHEYGCGPLFILCYWWFGNVEPAQHILYDHVMFSMTMSSWNFAHYFGYHEDVINGYALDFDLIFDTVKNWWNTRYYTSPYYFTMILIPNPLGSGNQMCKCVVFIHLK